MFNSRISNSNCEVDNDRKYKAYRQDTKIRPVVQTLLQTIEIDLSNGAGIHEIFTLQEYFREYRIIVYHGLSCEDVKFEGLVDAFKRINLHYENVERYYQVINKFKGAMARRYLCRCRNNSCASNVRHACDQTFSECMACHP